MLLFARVDVLGVAWLRIASAALVFALWRRPWRKFRVLGRRGRKQATRARSGPGALGWEPRRGGGGQRKRPAIDRAIPS